MRKQIPAKEVTQLVLEDKYRFYVKIACIICLVLIILIDAIFEKYQAPVQVELALAAIIGGIETKERIRKAKEYKKIKGKNHGTHRSSRH